MMNAHVANLLNEQVNKEFYSAYLYLDFANYFERIGLAGFAHYFKVQAQEERDHALMFYQYLQDSDQPVTLEAIARPDSRLGDRSTRSSSLPRSMPSMPPLPPNRITVPCASWTGSSMSRPRRKRAPGISSPRWSSSAAMPRAGSICWIRSWPLGSTPPRYRHDPLPLSFIAFRKGLRFCPEAFLLSPESGIFLAFLSLY